ncbi:hypothetical protein HKW97_11665 [Pseudomonas luteola]|uniref:hypothetical protein n=1 Tax=Pseudomonas luteola TaxID=47886 RepID=UPI003890DD78
MPADHEKEASKIHHIGEQELFKSGQTPILDKLTRREFMVRMVYLYAAFAFAVAFYFTASRNPEIFTLKKETLSVITEFYNALTLLIVPFILGLIGALARVLMAGIRAAENLRIIFSSGLMAAFSWLSLKSKVFLALVAPYIPHATNAQIEQLPSTTDIGSEFYSMALVAVLVGMFASNIYIAINQRVEKLATDKSKA